MFFILHLAIFNLRINKSSSDYILYILLLPEQESGLLQIRKSHGDDKNK